MNYGNSYILQEIQKSQFPKGAKDYLLSIVEKELKKIYAENFEKILKPHFKRWNGKKIILWGNSDDVEILIERVSNLKPIGIVEENKPSDIKKELRGIKISSSWQEIFKLKPEVIILLSLTLNEQEEYKKNILEKRGIELFHIYTPEHERSILCIEFSLSTPSEELLICFFNHFKVRNRLMSFLLAIKERRIKCKITIAFFGNENDFSLLKEELKTFETLDLEVTEVRNCLHFICEIIKKPPKLIYFAGVNIYSILASIFSTAPLIVDWQDIHSIDPRYLVELELLGYHRNVVEIDHSILEAADGVVHHGPDYFVPYDFIERCFYDLPLTFSFPDYCSRTIYEDKDQELLERKLKLLGEGEIHLLLGHAILGGGGRRNNALKMGSTIRIYRELLRQGIHLHYYGRTLDTIKKEIAFWAGNTGYEDEFEILKELWESPFFHYYDPLPLKEYIKKSANYHYGVFFTWNFTLITRRAMALLESASTGFGQRFFTFLAAGLPIVTNSDFYHFMYHQIYQNGVGVGLDKETILKAKEVLCDVGQYKKLVDRVLKVRERWAIENKIDGLMDFFDRVISMPPRRSGKEMEIGPRIPTPIDRKLEIEAMVKKGEFCEEIGDYKEALTVYEKILSLKPIDYLRFKIHLKRSKLFAEAGERKKALKELEQVTKSLDEDKIDTSTRANFYYNIGSIYESLNELGRAEREFKKILDGLNREKDDLFLRGGSYFHLGSIFMKMEKKKEAKKYFKRCLEIIPSHLKARELLENI